MHAQGLPRRARVAVSAALLSSVLGARPADESAQMFPTQQYLAGNKPYSVLVEDLDLDGNLDLAVAGRNSCLLYTSPSPRDQRGSRMPSSA